MKTIKSTSILVSILLILIVSGCKLVDTATPTKTPFSGGEILEKLNGWDIDELDALECPSDYPGYLVSGETHAYVEIYKSELQSLGTIIRWNCENNSYEVVSEGTSTLPTCGCN